LGDISTLGLQGNPDIDFIYNRTNLSLLGPTRWCAEASGHPVEADNSIPALQGAAAITYLKEHKLYDSLREVLHAARLQRGDNSVLTSKFIDEQKLTASDGAFNDIFGDAVFERHGGSWVETQKIPSCPGHMGILMLNSHG